MRASPPRLVSSGAWGVDTQKHVEAAAACGVAGDVLHEFALYLFHKLDKGESWSEVDVLNSMLQSCLPRIPGVRYGMVCSAQSVSRSFASMSQSLWPCVREKAGMSEGSERGSGGSAGAGVKSRVMCARGRSRRQQLAGNQGPRHPPCRLVHFLAARRVRCDRAQDCGGCG